MLPPHEKKKETTSAGSSEATFPHGKVEPSAAEASKVPEVQPELTPIQKPRGVKPGFKTFTVSQHREEREPIQVIERPKKTSAPIPEEFTAPDSKLEMMGPKKREARTYDEAALVDVNRDFSVIFDMLKEEPGEIKEAMSGQKLLEEMEQRREEDEWLPKQLVALEKEVKDLRDVLERLAANHVKLNVILDFMKSLGTYYYTHCKYPDKEGFCTNWFWSKRPNFQALDGTKLPVKMGEDGRYYVKPSFVMCALCSATATKYWL